jgi:hypothetical protein
VPDDDIVARIYLDTWPGAPPFLERECATADKARELERHWLAELAANRAYQLGKREGVSKQGRKIFAMQIRSRRDRLALILADGSQEWPPPAELTPWAKLPRDPPTREDARRILVLRAKNGKHGIHWIAGRERLGWRSVQWVLDVFES